MFALHYHLVPDKRLPDHQVKVNAYLAPHILEYRDIVHVRSSDEDVHFKAVRIAGFFEELLCLVLVIDIKLPHLCREFRVVMSPIKGRVQSGRGKGEGVDYALAAEERITYAFKISGHHQRPAYPYIVKGRHIHPHLQTGVYRSPRI